MNFLMLVKWILIWAVVTGAVYVTYKVTYNLVKKPNLRYYVWKTIKDMRYMYYRYHV